MDTLRLLKRLRANLKRPDHTGQIEILREPILTDDDWRPAPLHRNTCVCPLHQLHRTVNREIRKLEEARRHG